jgi:hypothetical protein
MRLILSTLLLSAFIGSFGQNKLSGKWYTFSFDMFKVVEYDFETSAFVSNKLDWKLKSQPGTQTARVIKIIESKEKLYYLLQDLAGTSAVTLSIFFSVMTDTSFVQATASDEHTNFKSTGDALAFIEIDTLSRPGLIFYSQKEFNRLKSLPDPATITKANYRKYLQGLIDVRANFEGFASTYKDDFGSMFFFVYMPNQARKILGSLGYNPVIDDQHLERVNEKFKDDPTLKKLMDKALKFE